MIVKRSILIIGFVHSVVSMQAPVSPDSLFKAVKALDKTQVLLVLGHLNDSNKKTVLEWQSKNPIRTPLLQCTIDNNLEIAALLVNAGADMFATDFTATSPISHVTDMRHRNFELLKVFLKTPSQNLQKKIEWILLRDLLIGDTLFSLEQNCTLVETMLALRPQLHYSWLEGLASKSSVMSSDTSARKEILPMYKAIASKILEHHRNHYKNQAQIIFAHLAHTEPVSTYVHRLPTELKQLIEQSYTELHIAHYRSQCKIIMDCKDF